MLTRALSSSSHSKAASDKLNQDKILAQCIIGGKEALSFAINIPRVQDDSSPAKHQKRTSAFGKEYKIETLFVESLVKENIIPGLGQVLANLFQHNLKRRITN